MVRRKSNEGSMRKIKTAKGPVKIVGRRKRVSRVVTCGQLYARVVSNEGWYVQLVAARKIWCRE